MAKCTITFEDGDDGDTKVNIVFDPPIDNPLHGHIPTPAQEVGWTMCEVVTRRADVGSIEDDGE